VDFVNNQLPEQFKLKYLHYDIKKDLRQWEIFPLAACHDIYYIW
jgi:hypothetical protein